MSTMVEADQMKAGGEDCVDVEIEQKEWIFPTNDIKIHRADLQEEQEKWNKLVKLCDQTMGNQEFSHQKDWACHIKTQLDEDPEFNKIPGKGPWQCVVGKRFAASITHDTDCLCIFELKGETFLIFKNLPVMADANANKKLGGRWKMVKSVQRIQTLFGGTGGLKALLKK